ncbi:conserved hypothetical protein [Crenothrix polyspora]|uniref:DUF6378 domain-containing protein n=2 Tax=Crenothrix polyspora TaxID=360316 RepID=A0A1R4H155_9GAMM|nr:conserved hypothetical protein [Crenothrix polyspora]
MPLTDIHPRIDDDLPPTLISKLQQDINRMNEENRRHTDIRKTLSERGARYGNFSVHANIAQNIKETMRKTRRWEALSNDKKEALEMMAHKLARILNGDPEYKDSWVDVAGYSTLIADTLK